MELGALLEPRTIITVVKDTMEAVVSRDDLLNKTIIGEMSEPALRNPQNIVDVATCIRLMSGEVRQRT
eukprot:7389851-Prorocentrum_lima.AAC.1